MRGVTKHRMWVSLALSPLAVIFYLNIEKWAEANGYDAFLVNLGTPKGDGVISAAIQWALSPTALAVAVGGAGFVGGLWCDALLRRQSESKVERLCALGKRCENFVSTFDIYISARPLSDAELLRQLWSLYLPIGIDIERLGLKTPDCGIQSEDDALRIRTYLLFVGPLLKHNQMKQAKQTAKNLSCAPPPPVSPPATHRV